MPDLSVQERIQLIIDENIEDAANGKGASFTFEAGALAYRNPEIAKVVAKNYRFLIRLIGLLVSKLPNVDSLEAAMEKSFAVVGQMEGLLFVNLAIVSEDERAKVIAHAKSVIAMILLK
jgi:hypothetical protein